ARISRNTEIPPTPESNTPIGALLGMAACTDGAVGITLDLEFAEAATERIDQQQTAHQRLTESGQQFEGFQRLQAAYQAHQRANHASLTAGQLRLAAMAVQAVVARAG